MWMSRNSWGWRQRLTFDFLVSLKKNRPDQVLIEAIDRNNSAKEKNWKGNF
jgi:hypothetical protein